MSQKILKNLKIGRNDTPYIIQDARVDDLENVISRTKGQQGIEVRNNRLALTNGGYYEDAAAFEDVNQTSVTVSSNRISKSFDNTDGMVDWVENEGQCLIWFIGETSLSGSTVDTIEGYEIEGHFEDDGQGGYLFVPDAGRYDYNIQDISFSDEGNGNGQITLYFDDRNVDSFEYTEIAMYGIGAAPQVWPADLVYSSRLLDRIVEGLIDGGYISDPNDM